MKFLPSVLVFFTPLFALAQTPGLGGIFETVGGLINQVTPIIIGLALVYFLWGVAKFTLSAGDESAKKEGQNIMVWGIIALFVMVAVWGLVGVLADTFNVHVGEKLQDVPGIEL